LVADTHQQAVVDCRKFPDQDVIVANSGSVGHPLNSKARYVVIDTEEMTADRYIAEYDTQEVIDRLESLDIPEKFWC
jgi:predicted phosphodiesterase